MRAFSILAAAAERPSAEALICPEGKFSFAELADRTRHVMAWLCSERAPLPGWHARTPHACFGVVGTSELWTVTLLYAFLELGVPFALIHPRAPRHECETLRQRFPIPQLFEPGWERALTGAPQTTPPATPLPLEAPLCVAFTAGTTGLAKASVISRGAFEHAASASSANFGWHEDDRWLLCLSLAHVGGLSIVLRCLAARRPVVLSVPHDGSSMDISHVARAIIDHQVTLISLVPTLLQRLLDVPDFILPPRVRVILLGGDGASPALLQRAQERRFPVFTSYGLTEMASQVATQRYVKGPLMDPGVGPPLPGVEVSTDDAGSILVRGSTLFSGYWHPPTLALTLTAEGWFCTQDRGQIDASGCVHVLGRSTDLIVTGGENVYPAQVESVLLNNPEVTECCVFGVPDETWGSVVCALLVGPSSLSPTLTAHIAGHLMPHQRPRRIALLPQLPRTQMGKLDRKAASENYRDQLLSLDYH